MPEKELMLLIETLTKQIQSFQEGQEHLRQYFIEQLKAMQIEMQRYALKEDIAEMEEDVSKIEQRLEEMEKKIIESQEEKFRQTIQMQGAILMLILGAFIASFFVPQLTHLFGH